MNSRDRFIKTMKYEHADRPPLFEDGIREEVLKLWHNQGLGKKTSLEALFSFDPREEIETILDPSPIPSHWPKTITGLINLSSRLDPEDPKRLPDDWGKKVNEWKTRDYPLILRIHRGYFLSMGVHGWRRFTDAIQLLVDEPRFVETWMNTCSEFSARLAEKILREVDVDAALFSEPIGGNHGPLISPKMYSTFVLESYKPILEVLHRFDTPTIIYRTYANTRALLPSVVKAGFNCLWACECNPHAMDYGEIRREFGRDLRLIGGIDADSLRQSQPDIHKAVMDVVPALLEDGGFVPLADGRVREDVCYENYVYYRRLLESVTC
ncbi:MAG: hypothetical protein A2Y53_00855 [Chloroflexi bacterium RBG_16_47_49]|nr:MAG: hypothetical protein A2Y53_00855 [Chloroflexi bacterium RBG_16_47_49]